MNHPSFQPRRRRRLPHVPQSARSRPPGTFWLTYSRAVDWLRRNHGVIDKTVELLEIYPTLIQEMSLDGLWDFLAPYVTSAGDKGATAAKTRPPRSGKVSQRQPNSSASRQTRHSGITAGRSSSTTNALIGSGRGPSGGPTPGVSDTLQVPVISITYASDDQEPELQALCPGALGDRDSLGSRTPRVYLSCLCQNPTGEETLHRHVLHALQHDFFVRSGPCADESAVVYWDDISEADVCVFLLDDPSLNTGACFRSLCVACSLNMPIVFLKGSSYSLPVPLPDIILQHNLGLESPELSRASSPVTPHRSTTPEMSHHPKLSPASEKRASSTPGYREPRSHRQQAKQNRQDSDMVLCLLNGYRNALVFEENRYQECEKELRDTIHKVLGTAQKEAINTNGGPTPVSKSSNTLFPVSRRANRPRSVQRTSLGVPTVGTNDIYEKGPSDNSAYEYYASDDDSEFSLAATPSDMAIDIPSDSYASRPGSFLSPHPYFQKNSHSSTRGSSSDHTSMRSRSSSPPPDRSSTRGTRSPTHFTSPSVTPSSGRSSSGRSFSHLQQFQQQIQLDRALFLSSVSPISDGGDTWESLEERQTVYMVCDKPKGQPPRLVRYPPSGPEEEERHKVEVDVLSESSDSPVGFRNVDLSTPVNKPLRGSDTPDSDASSLF